MLFVVFRKCKIFDISKLQKIFNYEKNTFPASFKFNDFFL